MKFPQREAVPVEKPEDSEADSRAEQEAVRGRFGIEALAEGEELLDDVLFECIQSRSHPAREEAEARSVGAATAFALPSEDPIEELLLEEVALGSEQRRRRGDVAPPPASPLAVGDLEAKLLAASDREQVARIGLRLARRYAAGAALFVVQGDLIVGLRAEIDEQERPVEGILVPLNAESLFSEALTRGRTVRQRGAHRDLDVHILRALGRSRGQEHLVTPVVLGGRVVSVLYADNGPAPLPETCVGALRALATGIASAYEAVIVSRKQRSS